MDITQALPLLGGYHDWAFVLGPEGFDALGAAGGIAAVVSGAGLLMVVAAVAGCLAAPVLLARSGAAHPEHALPE